MIKKVLFLALLIFTLSSIYAYADDLEISHVDTSSRVSPGESAEFLLTVKNTQHITDDFAIALNGLDIYPFSNIIESAEISPNKLTLKPGESAEVKVTLKIFDDAMPAVNYRTYVIVSSLTDQNVRKKEYMVATILLPINLVDISTMFPDKIIAGDDKSFNLTIKSNVNKVLKNIEVSISSELFQQTFKTDLYYGAPITKKIEYDLDSKTKPGKYSLSIKATYNNNIRGSLLKDFEVAKNQNIIEKNEMESGLLVNSYIFEKENKGNVITEESMFLPLGSAERYFMTSNIKYTKKTRQGYEWTFVINPGETYSIRAKTDYRIPFYGLLIIILFSIGTWYYMHKTIVIQKYLYHIKDDPSGVSELKIVLKLKNKGNPIRNVRVVDIVPGLLKPTGEYATLKPANTQNTYSGLRLVWDVPMLDMGDERIIAYKLHSKAHLFTTLTLPPAAVLYKKLSKQITKTSNKVVFIPKNPEKHKIKNISHQVR